MFENSLSHEECDSRLAIIRKLIARIRDGSLDRLSETRVEQSFNERLFGEVFDYRTLFRDGVLDYHLSPKGGIQVNRTRRYDDFSLGFFGARSEVRLVHAELKSYGADLDRRQTGGSYGGLSPVEQAFEAARHVHGVEWVIVSNFDELRLYHRDDHVHFARVVLSNLLTREDIRRAYALFGKPNLLGDPGRTAPLTRMIQNGHPMLLPAEPHLVRFIQEARPTSTPDEASLPSMDDAFRAALKRTANWSWPVETPHDPHLDEGRLFIDDNRFSETPIRLEYTRNGVVRLQEKLRTENPTGAAPPVLVSALNLADRMARFVGLSALMIGPVFSGPIAYRWSVLEGDRLAVMTGPMYSAPALRTQVAEATSKEFIINSADPDVGNRSHIAGFLAPAIRDLLFAWSHIPSRGKLNRLQIEQSKFEELLRDAGF